MTRIIGGLAGGARLQVPLRGTRPTSERVREAMFSALDEHHRLGAAKVAQRNADTVSKSGAVHALVEQVAVRQFLQRSGRHFDLVFIDPPYELARDELSATLADLAPLLQHPAMVVVEQARRAGRLDLPGDLELERSRDYGDTTVHYLSTTGTAADALHHSDAGRADAPPDAGRADDAGHADAGRAEAEQ
jgi:16S rRNA (guanine966-N2)-methyltransferase